MPELLGECVYDDAVIRLRQRLRRDKAREVLLHEVLHACHYNAGRDDDTVLTGEEWVEASVHSLLQVLRENPQLVAFLVG